MGLATLIDSLLCHLKVICPQDVTSWKRHSPLHPDLHVEHPQYGHFEILRHDRSP